MPVTHRRGALLVAAAATTLAACAPESVNDPPDTTVRIPDAPVTTGTVTAAGADGLVVDIGTARPVTVALAAVAATTCGPDGAEAFTRGLREVAPVGSAVTVVRSGGPSRDAHDLTAFVYLRADGDATTETPTGATVNERLLRAGRARLDPPVDRAAAAAPIEDQVAAGTLTQPAPDRDYFPALAAAETEAWTSGTGPIGVCAQRQAELDHSRTTVVGTPAEPSPPPVTQPSGTPPGMRLEITVERPDRPRPCLRLGRC